MQMRVVYSYLLNEHIHHDCNVIRPWIANAECKLPGVRLEMQVDQSNDSDAQLGRFLLACVFGGGITLERNQ